MPSLQFVTYETSATALETSQITDLEIVDTAAGPVLYATTRYDGAITAWSIDGTDLVVADTSNHRRNDAPGPRPTLR
jgi:hypothetical protein